MRKIENPCKTPPTNRKITDYWLEMCKETKQSKKLRGVKEGSIILEAIRSETTFTGTLSELSKKTEVPYTTLASGITKTIKNYQKIYKNRSGWTFEIINANSHIGDKSVQKECK